jgi:hypothetical protein
MVCILSISGLVHHQDPDRHNKGTNPKVEEKQAALLSHRIQ